MAELETRSTAEADDTLMTFDAENATPRWSTPNLRTLGVVAAVALTVPASWLGWQTWKPKTASAAVVAPAGSAAFHSIPAGAAVAIDGAPRGTTPLQLSLPAGSYSVRITSGSISRTMPLTVAAGAAVSHHVEFANAPALTSAGRLEIGSDPPGGDVRVDGVFRGVTPLALGDIAAGQHRITVTSGGNVVTRTVNVTGGATSSVLVSTAPAAAASGGWLSVDAPVEMDILEDGRVLGSTRSDRLMLPVGSHEIQLINTPLEFSSTREVQIAAGKTATLSLS